MATVNLSDYDASQVPSAEGMRIGVVVSEWNHKITNGLLQGAVEALNKHGLQKENLLLKYVPGSFELPLVAQWLLEDYGLDAVICLGAVIRGETAHFDYVCQATALGIKDVSLKYNKPVIFGVLTDDHIDQSIARSGGDKGNKGTEAAITAIKMVALQTDVES